MSSFLNRFLEFIDRIPEWLIYVIITPIAVAFFIGILILCLMVGGAFEIGVEALVEKIGEIWTFVLLISIWPLFIFAIWIIYKIQQRNRK